MKRKGQVMKTLWIIIALIFGPLVLKAESDRGGYVVADGITYLCQGMRTGFANTRIITAEGQLVKVPNSSVKAYRIDGRQFEIMPLLNLSGDTLDMAFMELISMRDGKRLYRYCSNCSKYDPLSGEIAPINFVYRYYVLSDGQLRLFSDAEINNLGWFKVKIINDQSHR